MEGPFSMRLRLPAKRIFFGVEKMRKPLFGLPIQDRLPNLAGHLLFGMKFMKNG